MTDDANMTVTVPTEVEELRARLHQLQADLNDAKYSVHIARSEHREDIERIGEALMEEAENRGWCSEYDTVIHNVNERMHVTLPQRGHEYTVSVTVRLRVSVTAGSAEDAKEKAEEAVRQVERRADTVENVISEVDDDDHWTAERS